MLPTYVVCEHMVLRPVIVRSFSFLQPAIGVVLGFIGTKMIFDFFGRYLLDDMESVVVLDV